MTRAICFFYPGCYNLTRLKPDELPRKIVLRIYHITHAPEARSLCLHFWGCNMNCRGCLCQQEIYDCHLEETKKAAEEARPLSGFRRGQENPEETGILTGYIHGYGAHARPGAYRVG